MKWYWLYLVFCLCKFIGVDWIIGFLIVYIFLGFILEVYNFNCFDIIYYYFIVLERWYDLMVYDCVFYILLSINRI